MTRFDTIIIGAGAAGMMCGAMAGAPGDCGGYETRAGETGEAGHR